MIDIVHPADRSTGGPVPLWALLCVVTALSLASLETPASDCNLNSVEDHLELHAPLGFAPARDYRTGQLSHAMDAADFDGDGDLDLVTADLNDDRVSVLINDGTGAFDSRLRFLVGNHPRGVVAADLDGDGWMDIAAHNENEDAPDPEPTVSILIHRGDGGPTFRAAVEIPSVPMALDPGFARSVAAADLDGDGALDLVLGFQGADQASVLYGDGRGAFSKPLALPDAYHTGFVVTGTIDANDTIDIAGSAGSWHVQRRARDFSAVRNEGLLARRSAMGCALADIDGDGDLDLVTTEYVEDGRVHVLANDGGAFSRIAATVLVGARPEHLAATDLDGDGHVDIAVANRSSDTVSIIRNLGDLRLVVESEHDVTDQPRWIIAGDLDGDGLTDLATVGYSSEVSILLRDPAPRASRDRDADGIPDACQFYRGDPDGDGAADLGDALFILETLFFGGPRSSCAESADVNDDGVRDIADVVYLLLFLHGAGALPGPPGPPGDAGCESDTGQPPFLGCGRYDRVCGP